jgi:hypothetical protein
MAVRHLRNRIPKLAAQFEEGQNFVAEGPGGTNVLVSEKRGKRKVRAKETHSNGLVMDMADVPRYIRNRLRKRGILQSEIESYVSLFAACEDGQKIQLPTGDTIVKSTATIGLPQLTKRFLGDRLPVLIAFEFLALCLGDSILGQELDAIRNFIHFGTKTEGVEVLNKMTRKYRPAHSIRFRVKGGAVKVFVQFFGWYVFEVAFRGVSGPPAEIVYIEDLESRQRLLALSPQDAALGNWAPVSPAIFPLTTASNEIYSS